MLIAKRRLKIESPVVEVKDKDGNVTGHRHIGVEKYILPNERFDPKDKELAKALIDAGHAVDEAAKSAPAPVVTTPKGPTVTLNEPSKEA
ncbi:hypothetical protein AAGS40_23235 [Paraburkholderia sp. PREW-6R]|uniref:hypothetical protein n=1 Tax=Paraburkholderia sp. PREW-6R TaxID=3141544 RepID=UPI0031F49B30